MNYADTIQKAPYDTEVHSVRLVERIEGLSSLLYHEISCSNNNCAQGYAHANISGCCRTNPLVNTGSCRNQHSDIGLKKRQRNFGAAH